MDAAYRGIIHIFVRIDQKVYIHYAAKLGILALHNVVHSVTTTFKRLPCILVYCLRYFRLLVSFTSIQYLLAQCSFSRWVNSYVL